LKANAQKKLISKNADMIIANAPTVIGKTQSQILIKTPQSDWLNLKGDKEELAVAILELIDSFL
jgi:phosphopantothenoylcysteine synthetase/decarboxylase